MPNEERDKLVDNMISYRQEDQGSIPDKGKFSLLTASR
jgi:hypothetical protein